MVEKILAGIIAVGYLITIGIMLLPDEKESYKVKKFFKRL